MLLRGQGLYHAFLRGSYALTVVELTGEQSDGQGDGEVYSIFLHDGSRMTRGGGGLQY